MDCIDCCCLQSSRSASRSPFIFIGLEMDIVSRLAKNKYMKCTSHRHQGQKVVDVVA